MKKKNKDIWFEIERIPDLNYVMLYNILVNYGKRLKKQRAGDFLRQIMFIMKQGTGILCYVRSEFDQTVNYIASKAIKNPAWLTKVNKEVELFADQYLAFARSLLKINISKLSDQQLIRKLERLLYFQVRSHGYGQTTTWLIDADYQLFSNYLFNHLKQKIKQKKLKLDPANTFSLITTPLKPSFTEIENQESLKLAQETNKNKIAALIFKKIDLSKIEQELKAKSPQLLIKLKKHQKKWFWLHYNYRGLVLELDYFFQIWQGLIKEGKINQHLKEAKNRFANLKKEQQELFKKLNFDSQHKKLFFQAQYIIWLKAYRKDCMYFGAYAANQFLKEIARRLFISFNQVEFMTRSEYSKALLKNKFNIKELDQRFKFSVIYTNWDKTYVYSGQQAKDFLNKLNWEKYKEEKIDKLTGQPACPGRIKGIVKIVEIVADMSKMNPGDVLVSETTYPALVPAMKKAGAIITHAGGLTCHAAIISRELKIPCVVGVKNINKILKDGDKVEVDATKGIVKKL